MKKIKNKKLKKKLLKAIKKGAEVHITVEAAKRLALEENTAKGREVYDFLCAAKAPDVPVQEPGPEPAEPGPESRPEEAAYIYTRLPAVPLSDNLLYGKKVIRTIRTNKRRWYMAKDVGDAIGLANHSSSLVFLRKKYEKAGIKDTSELINTFPLKTPWGSPDAAFFSMQGMYDFAVQSRVVGSHEFAQWVCKNILTPANVPCRETVQKKATKKTPKPAPKPEPIKETEAMEETPKPEPAVEVIDEPEEAHASSWITDPDNKDVIFDSYPENDDESIPNLPPQDDGKADAPFWEVRPETPNLPALQPFFFKGIHRVDIIDQNGDPWFIAKNVAEILGYSETNAMTRRLDADELNTCTDISSGQVRTVSIINESGLYNAIIGSHKPEAKEFKKWITSEVLPSIRKTGSYGAKPLYDMNDPNAMRRYIIEQAQAAIALDEKVGLLTAKVETITQEKEIIELEKEVIEKEKAAVEKLKDAYASKAEDLHKVLDIADEALTRMSETRGSLSLRHAATSLNCHQKDFIAFLARIGWIYKTTDPRDDHKPKDQRQKYWAAYMPIMKRGWMEQVTREVEDAKTGKVRYWPQVRVTHMGMVELSRRLVRSGIRPLNPKKPLGGYVAPWNKDDKTK